MNKCTYFFVARTYNLAPCHQIDKCTYIFALWQGTYLFGPMPPNTTCTELETHRKLSIAENY